MPPRAIETSKPTCPIAAQPRVKQLAYRMLAYLSLGLAMIGIITPGLPATEFLLLAAWASAKGSPRLNRWLHQHRLFGPMLRDWHSGQVRRRSKCIASLSMLLCFALLLWHQPPHWLLVLAAGGMSCGALWLWSRPEPQHKTSASPQRHP